MPVATRHQASENAQTSHHVKRAAIEQPNAPPPAHKRRFGDITNAIGNVALDSTKKPTTTLVPTRKATRRTASTVAPLATMEESDEDMPLLRPATRSSLSGGRVASQALPSTVSPFVDPAPHIDYDAEQMHDIFNLPHYAMDVFRYYRTREAQFKVGDYMPQQRALTHNMRAMLVDWMVEIQENFEMNHETLYQAVKMVDMYFACVTDTSKEKVQLIGATALFISAKFDERQPPLADDFLYICDDAYQREELMSMERNMLNTLQYDIGMPLTYRYVRRYAKAVKAPMELLTLARYILETSLLHYEFVGESESLVACAAFALASNMHSSSVFEWTAVHEKYTDVQWVEVEPIMWRLNAMLKTSGKDANMMTVYNKYSHEVFFGVARKFKAMN